MASFPTLRRFAGLIPVSKRLLLIIWPFLAVAVLLASLALRSIGVDYGQGYGIARPVPFGDIGVANLPAAYGPFSQKTLAAISRV